MQTCVIDRPLVLFTTFTSLWLSWITLINLVVRKSITHLHRSSTKKTFHTTVTITLKLSAGGGIGKYSKANSTTQMHVQPYCMHHSPNMQTL